MATAVVHAAKIAVAKHGHVHRRAAFPGPIERQREFAGRRLVQPQNGQTAEFFNQGVVDKQLPARADVDRRRLLCGGQNGHTRE